MRIIAHVDMDAYYASVEARYNPALRDKPVVVGADPKEGRGRGVVEAASYAARRYGIRSAMPISRAWKLAEAARRKGEPEVVFVHGNRKLYSEVSERVMAILASAGDGFEEASIDEAYLGLSSLGSFEAAVERARALKREIAEREGLTCSVGLAPNKLVAKIASDFKKPDGLTVVVPEDVQAFLDPLGIRVIPGIGPKTEAELHERGIPTARALPNFDPVAHFTGGDGERGSFVRRRRAAAAAIPGPAGESAEDEDSADRGEGGEAGEVKGTRSRGRGALRTQTRIRIPLGPP